MKSNIKIEQINFNHLLNKSLLDDPFSKIERFSKHPASKIAYYQALKGDLNKPHTLKEIKKKIGYEGNDKTLRETINALPFISEVERSTSYKGWGKPSSNDLKKDENREKLYQINPDKIGLSEEWIWEIVEGQTGIKKEEMIFEFDKRLQITEFLEWFISLTEEERGEAIKAMSDFYKWAESLSEKKRKQLWRIIFNENWFSLSDDERLAKLEKIKKPEFLP